MADRAGFGVLVAEHDIQRTQLRRALSSAPSMDRRLGREVRSFATGMRRHLRREDRALYPFCARLFGGQSGPVEVLRDDHRALKGKLTAIERALSDAKDVRPLLVDLEPVIDRHFGREEKVLFPLTAARLTEAQAAFLEEKLKGEPKR
ncbi:MAG: hemerythrin domain-containing protein [Methanobacteriota archaeon]